MNRLRALIKLIAEPRRAAYRAGVWFHTLQASKACYRADCIIQTLYSGGTVEQGVARSKRLFFRQGD